MANWLDKALGRDETAPVEPVPFVRVCQCGHRTDGQRRERAKRVICARCGVAHFILPVNPYPISERTFFEKAGQAADLESPTDADDPFIDPDERATAPEMDLVEDAWSSDGNQTEYADDDLADDDWDDDGDDDYELADSDAEIDLNPATARPKKKKTPSTTAASPVPAPEKPAVRRTTDRTTRLEIPSTRDGNRGQRLRIVAVSSLIIFVVGSLIAWNVRSRKLERAEVAMREGRDIGEVALKNRDFATARGKLREAMEAMALLGIEEKTQRRARQLWLQAEAGFGLLDDTDVVEIAMAAAETVPEDPEADDSDWQRRFRAQYDDRWLCIQLEPAVVISGDDEFGQRVVFPAEPAIHLVGVDAVLDQQRDGRLWFAGPIKSCRRDPQYESVWLIEFDSSRVIACDGTESLVRPMLTEEQQAAAMLAQAAETTSLESQDDDEQQEPDDE